MRGFVRYVTGEAFFIPIGAFASSEKLDELSTRLREAKVPYFSEPIATAKGKVMRVRAGPYRTREAADRALDQLKELGLKPGKVTARGA